ncbi:hypothetical protein WICPIJ_005191 [Wickerhamomyces pijperi]|uniref:Uncharacterized protein n=1 Tax=Wickerhamomyces pijperi TaxID=599730 RepID=A0A9P8Q669_WICPI|nr:hypothetical protein WICPIJ_005191 [Wickerhamomyces pijperi]
MSSKSPLILAYLTSKSVTLEYLYLGCVSLRSSTGMFSSVSVNSFFTCFKSSPPVVYTPIHVSFSTLISLSSAVSNCGLLISAVVLAWNLTVANCWSRREVSGSKLQTLLAFKLLLFGCLSCEGSRSVFVACSNVFSTVAKSKEALALEEAEEEDLVMLLLGLDPGEECFIEPIYSVLLRKETLGWAVFCTDLATFGSLKRTLSFGCNFPLAVT